MYRRMILIVFVTSLFCGAEAFTHPMEFTNIFPRNDDEFQRCGGEEYPEARATIRLRQAAGKTSVVIQVTDAKPNEFWTVWVRHGEINPLNLRKVIPLAPTSEIPALAAVTPDDKLNPAIFEPGTGDDGTGSTEVANGFWTNEYGNGRFRITVDFPVIKGAYQYQDLDLSNPIFKPGVELGPILVATLPQETFSIRVVTHCVDHTGHGLIPAGEPWFDWTWSASSKEESDEAGRSKDESRQRSDEADDRPKTPGDANGDGVVDLRDVVELLRKIVG